MMMSKPLLIKQGCVKVPVNVAIDISFPIYCDVYV